jgi:hypothetical protein
MVQHLEDGANRAGLGIVRRSRAWTSAPAHMAQGSLVTKVTASRKNYIHSFLFCTA